MSTTTPLSEAASVFNGSEFPRRIAGVARSLGAPEVSIWAAEHHAEVVRILIAWELSWYRYEVDLTEQPPTARVLEQGSELTELPRTERLANAAVDRTARSSKRPVRVAALATAPAQADNRSVIYCVVPRELEDELFPRLVEHYRDDENVTVIVDRREFDRRGRERGPAGPGNERRTVRDRRRARVAGDPLPLARG